MNTEKQKNICNTCDAAGIKLRKTAGSITTDYVGNFIYEDNLLKYIITDYGKINLSYPKNGDTIFTRQYNLTDHLGNVRVTFDVHNNNMADIVQEDSYYPFGMIMNGLDYRTRDIDKKNLYLYNGKELQEDFGLDWYDYGARFYDAQLGRWHVNDPKLETYYNQSPYNYALNNPIRFVDPNGTFASDIMALGGITVGTGQERKTKKTKAQEESAKKVVKSYTTTIYTGISGIDAYGNITLSGSGTQANSSGSNNPGKENKNGKSNDGGDGDPPDGKNNSGEVSSALTVVGVALIKYGKKLNSACITKNGKIVILPTERAYNLFVKTGKFEGTISQSSRFIQAGKFFKGAGTFFTVLSVYSDVTQYKNNEISETRLSYRLTGTGTSLIVGAEFGGWYGAGVSLLFNLGELANDNIIVPIARWGADINYQIEKFYDELFTARFLNSQ